MTGEQGRERMGRSASPELRYLAGTGISALIMVAVALVALAIGGPLAERLTLTGPTWQWTSSVPASGEAPITVPDPAAYTLDFSRDFTFAAVADCNRVAGTYGMVAAGRAGGSMNRLTIEPGPATLAACAPGSLAETFVALLGRAAFYVIDGTELTIELAGGGSMTYEAVPAAPSPGATVP